MDKFTYTYAVAHINALGTKLLDREFASRILAAEPEEILAILGETDLSDSFAGVDAPFEAEKGLKKELRKAYDLVEQICPNKKAMRLFRYRHDFHNLKAMLKAQVRGIPHDEFMIDLCTFDIDELAAAVNENNYRFVPEHLGHAALESLAEHEKTGFLAAIGYTCDRFMWQYIMQKARESREKIMIELFREYVNLANLKTFLRCREFSHDEEVFRRQFIPGGSYSFDFFQHCRDEDLSVFIDHLSNTRYEQHIISQGLQTWPEERSFWRLEKASDDFLLHYFHQMRHQIFSIAPLIYYLLRKIADTRLIRTVIRCKLIGMPRTAIEERLRYIYV
jgi:V/A-type H+-transporting ATPase subunit C